MVFWYCLVVGICECIYVCAYSYSIYCTVPSILTLTVAYYLRACDEVGGVWGLWKSESSMFCVCCL